MQTFFEEGPEDYEDEESGCKDDNFNYKRSFNQDRRENNQSGGRPNKRMRTNLDDGIVEMRCVVPNRSAGGIIGKSGANIKDMRDTFKANIQVPDSRTQNRVLTVQADIDACGDILMRLLPVINDPNNRSGLITQNSGMESDSSIKLLVHQTQAGSIIGTKGENIKALRQQTRAHIKIHQDCCPNSTDRVCQITGESEVVIDCVKTLLRHMQENPPTGIVRNYDPEADSYGADDFGNNGWGNVRGNMNGRFRVGRARGGEMGRGRGGGFSGNHGRGYGGGRNGGQRGGVRGFRRGGRGGSGGYRGGQGGGRNNGVSGNF